MALVRVTAATDAPVSLSEAQSQCRITDSAHDMLLIRLISAATQSIETMTGAILAPQTLRLELNGFNSACIDLGAYPVTAIDSFVYDDADDIEQTLVADTDYWESLGGNYPSLSFVESWPVTKSGKPATVRITMTAGYANAADVPNDIRHAILLRVKEYFDNAGESVTGSEVFSTVSTVKALTDMHRRMGV